MAWQLHYTSARRGPTGRAGFQFVAETPGLPDGVRAAVTPHLAYRPPPEAPLSPGDGELGAFPVALLYDSVDGRPLLLRCRYLGQDYSGRYGNFFAHAVVAEPDELEGLRPAELWNAPLWDDGPADDAELPDLADLTPGDAFAPDTLAAWLTDGNGHPLLARVVDAVAGVLGRGHGRVVLIAGDVELIARWIAVVSYSLPVAAAARLSFVTYSADPEAAGQRLVGTTPDVWASAQHHGSTAFVLGAPAPPGEPSRFAATVAACWQDADFAGLDALGELALLDSGDAGPGPAELDRAAGLLALCRGDTGVRPAEEDEAAGLLARHGTAIPEWVWRDLVPGVPSMGFDLALAVHDRARDAGAPEVAEQCALRATALALSSPALRARLPKLDLPPTAREELASSVSEALAAAADLTEVAHVAATARPALGEVTAAAHARARAGAADLPAALDACPAAAREALLGGALDGLEAAGDAVRAAVLDDGACDLLYGERERLAALPAVARHVLAAVGARSPGRRVAVTGELLALDGASAADLDPALSRVWAEPPDAEECLALIEAQAAAMTGHPALAVLPSRTFTRLATPAGAALDAPQTLRLAARVRAELPGGGAERDAALVQAYCDAAGASTASEAASAVRALDGANRLAAEAFAGAAGRLGRRAPAFRAELLAALPEGPRARLGEVWSAELPGRARGADTARRNELIEVVLRLRLAGARDAGLEAWARAAAARWAAGRRLDAHFAGERELRTALRDLLAEGKGR
ncbi:GAP1-N2 domain-containing protein [Actinomadura parmotrematis]|uniref:Uncharacterized protein n=1 Tax=Actinomadura parmotrematis TaxID=2864039 RepID=A0ABS7G0R1_9ACTN|nr:hypothetical protein [Actinomadura parmotrematis]MBW8485454.1 hypothetical protein [Actinomadura parmotrematis]